MQKIAKSVQNYSKYHSHIFTGIYHKFAGNSMSYANGLLGLRRTFPQIQLLFFVKDSRKPHFLLKGVISRLAGFAFLYCSKYIFCQKQSTSKKKQLPTFGRYLYLGRIYETLSVQSLRQPNVFILERAAFQLRAAFDIKQAISKLYVSYQLKGRLFFALEAVRGVLQTFPLLISDVTNGREVEIDST